MTDQPSRPISEILAEARARARDHHGEPPKPKPMTDSTCRPDCPICGGFGYVRAKADAAPGDPLFGKLAPCPRISVWALIGEQSGLVESEIGLNWNHLLSVNGVDQARDAVKKALDDGYGWVYLWGEYGLAKSHILKIAVAQVLQARKQAAYIRMSSLLDDLRSAYDKNNPNQTLINKLDWYAGLGLIAIDEFDRIKETEWATERRFALMDRRYEDALRRKSITLLASNQPPEALEGYLADRIRDGRFAVIELKGKSLRPGIDRDMEAYIYSGGQVAYDPNEDDDD